MTDNIAREFIDSAERHLDSKRLASAINDLDAALRTAESQAMKALAAYNLGSVWLLGFGDGRRARDAYGAVVEILESTPYPDGERRIERVFHKNALENLMINALSFEEFEAHAEKLARLDPEADIIVGLVPTVRERRDRGGSWLEQFMVLAYSTYDHDPSRDRGNYGQGKSALHLILTHRRELRASRLDWTQTLREFIVLSQRMYVDCANCGERAGGLNRSEYADGLAMTLPLIDEFLISSNDATIVELRGTSVKILQRADAPSPLLAPASDHELVCEACGFPLVQPDGPCPRCGVMQGRARTVGCMTTLGFLVGFVSGAIGGFSTTEGHAWWLRALAGLAAGIALGWATALGVRLVHSGPPR